MKKLCKNAYLLYNILSTFENILKFCYNLSGI